MKRTALFGTALLLAGLTSPLTATSATAQVTAPGVDLIFNFPEAMPKEARDAMLAVEAQLAETVGSTIPIVVDVTWEVGGDENTLASAGPTEFRYTAEGVALPIALANALEGEDLAPGVSDIQTTINADLNWDYHLGSVGPTQFDFVGTMVHEFIHGLGFPGGSANSCDGENCYLRDGGDIDAWSTFLVLGDGTPLTDFEDGSPEMYAAHTSNDVFWNGPLATAAATARPDICGVHRNEACSDIPVIYAPTVYEQGSSMSHLDEASYLPGTGDAQMTPSGEPGENTQFMGPIAHAMLLDIGWPDSPFADPTGNYQNFDGNDTTRLNQANPTLAAVAVSQMRFPTDKTAPLAILSRDDKFADALSATGLTHYGPLLLTPSDSLNAEVEAELGRVLREDATVYIVGGPNAIAQSIEDDLALTYTVVRLSGTDRFVTSAEIAYKMFELNQFATYVLVARGYGPAGAENGSAAWADSISAAAAASYLAAPLLLVGSDSVDQVTIDAINHFKANGIEIVVLGGPGAVSQGVFDFIEADRRVAGTSRETTAVAIARELMQTSPSQASRGYIIVHARDQEGWAWGLAAAGLAGDGHSAILLVDSAASEATLAEVRNCGTAGVELVIAGNTDVISASVVAQLDAQDNADC